MSNLENSPEGIYVARCLPVFPKDLTALIIQRRPGSEHNELLWEFGGGQVEDGEEIEAAVRREMKEETGIQIGAIHGTRLIQKRIIQDGWRKGTPYTLTAGVAAYRGGQIKLSDEHVGAEWLTFEQIKAKDDLTAESRLILEILGPLATRAVQ